MNAKLLLVAFSAAIVWVVLTSAGGVILYVSNQLALALAGAR
jgi:hypothetical protein